MKTLSKHTQMEIGSLWRLTQELDEYLNQQEETDEIKKLKILNRWAKKSIVSLKEKLK